MRVVDLKAGEVRVWFAGASPAAAEAARYWLSPEELERAERVRVMRARDEFVVGRALLRVLAGQATGVVPRSVEISVGAMGKLRVPGVECNVAHSRGMVALALARDAAIGVDVEAQDRAVEALDVARDTFAPGEVEEIEAAREGERTAIFCRIWTKKEAVLKAHGQGLTKRLDTFAVSAREPGEAAVVLDDGSFFVREIVAPDGFVAAVACARGGMAVHVVELDGAALIHLLQDAEER